MQASTSSFMLKNRCIGFLPADADNSLFGRLTLSIMAKAMIIKITWAGKKGLINLRICGSFSKSQKQVNLCIYMVFWIKGQPRIISVLQRLTACVTLCTILVCRNLKAVRISLPLKLQGIEIEFSWITSYLYCKVMLFKKIICRWWTVNQLLNPVYVPRTG